MEKIKQKKRLQKLRSTIIRKIRASKKYKDWMKEVLWSSGFKCSDCGMPLEYNAGQVHHKVHLSKIVDDNNLLTLEQALTCKELWNLNNGTVLCCFCHSGKHPNISFMNM